MTEPTFEPAAYDEFAMLGDNAAEVGLVLEATPVVRRESIALAERRAAQAEITIQQAQQAIIQSVETFFATHQAAAPQITAARAAIVAGERSVQDGLLRYRAGLSPLTELLVAQRNLQIARSAEANAIYRWNLSRAALELETGFVR